MVANARGSGQNHFMMFHPLRRLAALLPLFLILCACAGQSSEVRALADEPAHPVFRDPFFLFEFEQPGVLERVPTAEENSTLFTVDGKRRISFIRRYTTMKFEDFIKDFESRVLTPQFLHSAAEQFDVGPVRYGEAKAKIYGVRATPPPAGSDEQSAPGSAPGLTPAPGAGGSTTSAEAQLSFILIAQKGNTFMIAAGEGFGESELTEYRRMAGILSRSLHVEDTAKLYAPLETDALKACKLVTRLGFGGLRRDLSPLLKICINMHPYFDGYYSFLAETDRLNGHEADSLVDLEKGLSVFPSNPTLINNQAWYLLTFQDQKLRDYPRALELAKRAAELTKRQSSALLHTLAQAYVENGDIPAALKVLEECKALSGQDPATQKAIHELETRINRMRT